MSFQVPEQGLEYQDPMPQAPHPDTLESEHAYWTRLAAQHPDRFKAPRRHAVDYRQVDGVDHLNAKPRPALQGVWMRANGNMPDDPGMHAAMLAYMSDNFLMSTAMLPHGMAYDNPRLQNASLDHAMWFYGQSRADEWHYFDMASPRSAGGRGFNTGWIYTQDGSLVATAVQEGMMRLRTEKTSS